jgi:mannose-1-phosphate guanylyltransferase
VNLHAVILAGGSGTRFWPRSRASLPKQFLALGGRRTLIQATVDRLAGLVPPERVLVVTGKAHRALALEQLPEVPQARIVAEPAPRDTAAAIGLATWIVARDAGDDAILAVLPSDHVIEPAAKLREALALAAERARGGAIVTFGIKPTFPSSAYGYVRLGAQLAPGVNAVEAFEEKPDRAKATRFVEGGRHAWNSGMFVFAARTMMAELRKNLPKTADTLERIAHDETLRESEWSSLQKISIDYAVLEKASRIEAVATDFAWSDVGSWSSAGELFAKDAQGNAVDGASFVGVDARNNVVAGDGRLVGIVGLDDVIVVQQGNATLVCRKDRAEDVKKMVAELEKRGYGSET